MITIIGLGIVLGFFLYSVHEDSKRRKRVAQFEKEERDYQQRVKSDIYKLQQERKQKPLVCKVCSKGKKRKVYFKGLAWFHCPRCGEHGFASIYDDCCTMCANRQRGLA